jgi:hypothetical protein
MAGEAVSVRSCSSTGLVSRWASTAVVSPWMTVAPVALRDQLSAAL